MGWKGWAPERPSKVVCDEKPTIRRAPVTATTQSAVDALYVYAHPRPRTTDLHMDGGFQGITILAKI